MCNNAILTNAAGLHNITSIGGELWITDNLMLENIEALAYIALALYYDLYIINNPVLSQCDIDNICDYLAGSTGTVEIYDNAPGCSSPEEVEEACLHISIPEVNAGNDFSISPNPIETFAKIEYTLNQSSKVTLQILDLSGRVIQTLADESQNPGIHTLALDASHLKPGVYFCILNTNEGIQTMKMIKL